MLLKDFLQKNVWELKRDNIVFDWSWDTVRYEMKIYSDWEVTHRLIHKGRIGPWTTVKISKLRAFEFISVSVLPRKLVGSGPVIRVITDDGNRR